MSEPVVLHANKCQNPDPRDSRWRELNYPNARDVNECMRECKQNTNAVGFQFNEHDKFCGCLSVAPGTTMPQLMRGPNVFEYTCTIGEFVNRR